MTTCVISQPRFFPSLHFLHRMMLADVFVVLDNVRFNPRHEENRTKLRSPDGWRWLSVPTQKVDRRGPIRQVRIATDLPWSESAAGMLRSLYLGARYFEDHEPEVLGIIRAGHDKLVNLAVASWHPAIRRLGISCEFVNASELTIKGADSRSLSLICAEVGADAYVSGAFGREYLDLSDFAAVGVKVGFHDFRPQPYAQMFDGFIPFLSYLDVLFNESLSKDFVAAQGSVVKGFAGATE